MKHASERLVEELEALGRTARIKRRLGALIDLTMLALGVWVVAQQYGWRVALTALLGVFIVYRLAKRARGRR